MLVWTELLFLFLLLDQGSCSLSVREYDILAYRNINNAVPLATYEADSLAHCASFCRTADGCQSFSIDLDALSTVELVTCNTMSSYVTSASDLVSSSLHYAQDRALGDYLSNNIVAIAALGPVTIPTNIPQTSTPSSTTIIDIVYGVKNVCNPSSQKDFLVITMDQVYYYDDIYQMASWSCKQESYESAFPGYTDLPPQDEIVGVLKHQENVELYTESKVFRWRAESDGTLTKAAFSTVTISAHLHPDLPNAFSQQGESIIWAAHRARSSVERHFYFGGDSFEMYSEQWGIYSYTRSDVVNDQNGFNMNPWSDIPSDTIAVTGYTDQSSTNFALVTSSGKVYWYELDYGSNSNNPPKTLTEIGLIYFP